MRIGTSKLNALRLIQIHEHAKTKYAKTETRKRPATWFQSCKITKSKTVFTSWKHGGCVWRFLDIMTTNLEIHFKEVGDILGRRRNINSKPGNTTSPRVRDKTRLFRPEIWVETRFPNRNFFLKCYFFKTFCHPRLQKDDNLSYGRQRNLQKLEESLDKSPRKPRGFCHVYSKSESKVYSDIK